MHALRSRVYLRPLQRSDAEAASTLAWRAKASRGYPWPWLHLWREELTFDPEEIAHHYAVGCFSLDGMLLSAGMIVFGKDVGEITHMWAEPKFQGYGLGHRVIVALLQEARRRRIERVVTVSDPGAFRFYSRHGFVFLGWLASQKLPGRRLPVMFRRAR